jgi:ubiquinone/menaquinone biosynthesis C-methylase UbiE
MLEKARRKLEAEGLLNVGYTLADAGKLPLSADSFDVLYLVTVLGEIADRRAFLREARRVLKPGGTLSISEHLPDPDFTPFARVKSLVEEEGFEFLERHGVRWSYTANFSGKPGASNQAQRGRRPTMARTRTRNSVAVMREI